MALDFGAKALDLSDFPAQRADPQNVQEARVQSPYRPADLEVDGLYSAQGVSKVSRLWGWAGEW